MTDEGNLRLKVNLGLAAGLVVLGIVGGMAFWSTDQFAQAARERREGYETRIRLAGLLADLRDAETGQRGYLLTGERQYLEPFVSGSTAVTKSVDDLQELTVGDPLEQRHLQKLRPLIQAKLAELSRTVALYQEGHRRDATRARADTRTPRFG